MEDHWAEITRFGGFTFGWWKVPSSRELFKYYLCFWALIFKENLLTGADFLCRGKVKDFWIFVCRFVRIFYGSSRVGTTHYYRNKNYISNKYFYPNVIQYFLYANSYFSLPFFH